MKRSSRRLSSRPTRTGLPGDWRPCQFVITRLRPGSGSPSRRPPGSEAPAPQSPASRLPGSDSTASSEPPPFDPAAITLNQILDTFSHLPALHSRVFAGFFEVPSPGSLPTADPPPTWLAPMVSGAALPGSRVVVTFSDELGLPQSRVTVHSDQNGHWIAALSDRPQLSDTHGITLEITPPLWSGETQSEQFFVSFPAEHLVSQPARQGGVIGTVLTTRRADGTAAGQPAW